MQRDMRTLRRRCYVAGLLAVGFLAPIIAAHAGDKAKANEDSISVAAADDSASEALRASVADETVGDEKSRVARLDAAIEANPDAPEPRWQRGLMKTVDGWRDAAECQLEVSDAEKKYRELRDRVADDFVGNKQLARFCQKHKLPDNARGHWLRVVSFVPDDAEARKALGHVRFEGTWTTKEEVKRVERVRKEFNAALNAWSKKVPGWLADWRSDDAKRKEKGCENLLTIQDAAAVPLLQAGLAYRSEEDTLLLTKILCAIPDIQATRIIAELAVANPSPQVFRVCTEELRERDEQAFAPQLLIAMSNPITSEMRLDVNPTTNRILYRHVFTREGQYTRQIQAIGRDYGQGQLVGYPDPYSFVGLTPAERERAEEKFLGNATQRQDAALAYRMAESMATAMDRERRKSLENLSIEETNRRVSLVLSKVFDENYGSPDQWWVWWNQRNEVQYAKSVRAQVQYDQVVDDSQSGASVGVQNILPELLDTRPRFHLACFAAGTPVSTPQGLRTIESIKTGDLVLAQDVETGEIAWKPVIQPTKRSATKVLKLTVGDESFFCSLKHPFWKTGRGWIWAKELAVGDLVRTINGSLPVTEIESQPDAPLFNLVVSDFSTYFVGKNRTLTHDISYRKPTLAIAPGVLPAKEEVAAK